MRYELFIAFRYIFGKRREKFISVVTLISILGVAVGVAALIATLAVMSGFDNELKARIIGSNPHIFLEKELGIEDAEDLSGKINDIEGVKGSFPYIWNQGIIEFRGRARGIVLRSVDTKNEIDSSKLLPFLVSVAVNRKIEEGPEKFKEFPGLSPRNFEEIPEGLIIGSELASALGVDITDEVALITPDLRRPHNMKITGIFKSGMYDYDANVVYAGLGNLLTIFGAKTVSGIGIDCISLANCKKVKEKLQENLGRGFFVSTWAERNKNLFSAIKLEKLAMFVILTLIVIVACFSIIGVLVMTVMEKGRDIGILKAIGVSRKGILTIFSMQGFVIGVTGVIFGLLGGLGVSFLLKEFVKLPPEVYYIDRIPIKFHVFDSIVIIIAALVISLLATMYPAYQASKLEPIEALRYE